MRALALLMVLCVCPAAMAKSIGACQKEKKLRSRAGCLLDVVQPGAIPALHKVAQEMLKKDTIRVREGKVGIGARQDFFYAAENAGVIAAKTSEKGLYKLLGKKDRWTQLFALRGLSHMLSILRMGYAKGREPDEKRRAELKDPVVRKCLAKVRGKDEMILEEAAKCIGETRDNKHAKKLVQLIVRSRSSEVQSAFFQALKNLSRLSQQAKELRPLLKVLLRPMPKKWSTRDVWIRADICGLMARYVNHGDTWAQKPAEKAIEAIGAKNSQALRKCKRLLNRI